MPSSFDISFIETGFLALYTTAKLISARTPYEDFVVRRILSP
jgi:hypothetical protein